MAVTAVATSTSREAAWAGEGGASPTRVGAEKA